jgi:ABC-type enterochelin transport system substrate-binding protein
MARRRRAPILVAKRKEGDMGVLDLLKKLGVVKMAGGAATYRTAGEKPDYLTDYPHANEGKDKGQKKESDKKA